jgi:hypothetical protein
MASTEAPFVANCKFLLIYGCECVFEDFLALILGLGKPNRLTDLFARQDGLASLFLGDPIRGGHVQRPGDVFFR